MPPVKPAHLREQNPFADSDSSDSDQTADLIQKESPRPPQLPPRPTYNAPPPLPQRPSAQSIRNLNEDFKIKETLFIPNTKRVNRRPPVQDRLPNVDLSVGKQKMIQISGEHCACLQSEQVKIVRIRSGETIVQLQEKCKWTSLCFVPSKTMEDEGKYLWIGTDKGELLEIDMNGRILDRKQAHNGPVTHIIRSGFDLITCDDNGGLKIWQCQEKCLLSDRPRSWRISSKTQILLYVNGFLWAIAGKQIEIYHLESSSNNLLVKKFEIGFGLAAIVQACAIQDRVYLGHDDGKISVYVNFEKQKTVVVSAYAIKSLLAGVDNQIWVGFGTGKISVFDTEEWYTIKDFQGAYSQSIVQLTQDVHGLCRSGYLNIASLSDSGSVRIWDGFLYKDRIEEENRRNPTYNIMTPIQVVVLTWNIDSRKPSDMEQGDLVDRSFMKELFQSNAQANLFVIGFQELVDLESKSQTAKSLFAQASKEVNPDLRLKLWQDKLMSILYESLPNANFQIVSCQQMVGLFQLIVSKSITPREIGTCQSKTGLAHLHGNKGALVTRFLINDSAFCFVNCHLAAHQSQVSARNNDIQYILKDASFPKSPQDGVWQQGGDGTQILDHESIIWSGDLNYRIDLTRQQVIDAIDRSDFSLLHQHDQLIKQREFSNFGLRDFQELPLDFAPTFKYNRGTYQYDSSEKMRIPAYCDRILYKGDLITCHAIQRHECKISDHRPVSSIFSIQTRTIDQTKYIAHLKRSTRTIDDQLQTLIEQQQQQWLQTLSRQ
ncbi:Endonuclease/exonuclease/phosphatase [Gorgonomyces haynaldii]|nr:Endonuclease/exonuclease/phosphatase [Gorgonomyces haynaldii]